MVIFNSYVSHYQRVTIIKVVLNIDQPHIRSHSYNSSTKTQSQLRIANVHTVPPLGPEKGAGPASATLKPTRFSARSKCRSVRFSCKAPIKACNGVINEDLWQKLGSSQFYLRIGGYHRKKSKFQKNMPFCRFSIIDTRFHTIVMLKSTIFWDFRCFFWCTIRIQS